MNLRHQKNLCDVIKHNRKAFLHAYPDFDDFDSDSDNISESEDIFPAPDLEEMMDEEKVERGQKKDGTDDGQDPNLSKLYELAIKDEIEVGLLELRKPISLKVEKVEGGCVHLSFCDVLNEEEKGVLAGHDLEENIRYRVAVCKNGSDKWTKCYAKSRKKWV